MIKPKGKKGFTLLEMIIVVTVLTIVIMMLGGVMLQAFQSSTTLSSRNLVHNTENHMRAALLSMVRDIRLSDSIHSSTTADKLVLTARCRNDNSIFEITYEVIAGELTRVFSNPLAVWPIGFVQANIVSFSVGPASVNAVPIAPPSNQPPNITYLTVGDTNITHVEIKITADVDGTPWTITGFGAIQRVAP